MKFLIASDLHGDLNAAKALRAAFEGEGADRLVLLGDLLYHGPRNDLPSAYDPKGVIALLNRLADKILAVRGNCDTEVDQMVLDFPILADYAILPLAGGGLAYLTHGHRYHEEAPPPLQEHDVLIHGHTHVAGVTRCRGGQPCFNPGSISMPKGGTAPSYILYDGVDFSIRPLEAHERTFI
ncbi:MAG: phosphodiesterase [Ruminococcaceae bacterium]|nr:phosphodiesterase [Oscillospiraceae bacterium]